MAKVKAKGELGRWLKEKWVRTDTGEPCGSGEGVSKSKKYCRPTKRISKKTPKTVSELGKDKVNKKEREKKRLSNSGKKPSRVKSVRRKK